MSRASFNPISIVDWHRSNNTVSFPFPKCGTPIKAYAGDVDDKGKVGHVLTCGNRRCDWKGSVRFDGYKPRTGAQSGEPK